MLILESEKGFFYLATAEEKDILESEECLHLGVKKFFYVTTDEKRTCWSWKWEGGEGAKQ